MRIPVGCIRGKGGRLCNWLFLHSLFASLAMADVKGETQNAHIELSDAAFNVVHHSEWFKFNKSTLGSIRHAVDALNEPIICLSILSSFFL